MSGFYPLAFARLNTVRTSRVVSDTFDAGGSASRRLWSAQYFRRRFEVEHMPLTLEEWRYLRTFNTLRSGRYESFYFRDNGERKGNFLVRFAQDLPVTITPDAMRRVRLMLEETSATRELPEIEEVYTAAGSENPLFWYDANRMKYYTHAGTAYEESGLFDVREAYAATAPGDAPIWTGAETRYNYWSCTGNRYAKSASNVTLSGSQPALTLFLQHYTAPVSINDEMLLQVGNHGIVCDSGNDLIPYIGGSGTWTNARQDQGAALAWKSVAVVFTGSSNNASLYVNAALVGTDTNARSYSANVVSVGGKNDGTLTIQGGRVQNVMAFNKALSLAQIKALHNLFAYQFSLTEVA